MFVEPNDFNDYLKEVKKSYLIAVSCFLAVLFVVILLNITRVSNSPVIEQSNLMFSKASILDIFFHNMLVFVFLFCLGCLTRGYAVIFPILMSLLILWIKGTAVFEVTQSIMFSFLIYVPHSLLEILSYTVVFVVSKDFFFFIIRRRKSINWHDVGKILSLGGLILFLSAIFEILTKLCIERLL